ncbi:beta-catenin-like protein 1 [Brevipalpus obovatus]|uniref:beta-catenin-like protein 1 n=1 Tax=Brevipalpus obovatus TaxID=246614 RepID=UPI003D9E2A26
MDVEELLNYKPKASIDESTNKSAERTDDGKRAKKRKLDLNTSVDSADAPPPLDEAGLKRLVLQFERRLLKNQEFRIKFADDPTKFMETEIELFAAIEELHCISTQPELFHTLIELKVVSSLMGLLSHENSDISCAVVRFLHELTDLDDNSDYDKVAPLLNVLIQNQIIAQLVANMGRLDESSKEESEGVYNSLAIIENLLDFRPKLAEDCQSLITWLLGRIKAKIPFDGNKLYACEVLAILLQSSEDNRKFLGSIGGIDVLLQQIAYIKRHDVSSSEEKEYLENLFDCLCSSLLLCSTNRKLFYEGEGIELMNLILKERKKEASGVMRMGAIKVINHLLNEDKGKDSILEECCNKFIEIYGLSSLFPIFLKPKIITAGEKKKETSFAIDDVEEHCCSIILALLKHSKPEAKKRVLSKFLENNLEKTERLVELHFKYAERLLKYDALIHKEKAIKAANDEEMDDEEIFLSRLTQGGLYVLQLIDHIILTVCKHRDTEIATNSQDQPSSSSSTGSSIKSKIVKLLNIHASSTVNHQRFIRNIMGEMAEEKDESERERIFKLIEEF